ncbi:hypothetical protein B9479_008201, partial [Cryptococcus floricola]
MKLLRTDLEKWLALPSFIMSGQVTLGSDNVPLDNLNAFASSEVAKTPNTIPFQLLQVLGLIEKGHFTDVQRAVIIGWLGEVVSDTDIHHILPPPATFLMTRFVESGIADDLLCKLVPCIDDLANTFPDSRAVLGESYPSRPSSIPQPVRQLFSLLSDRSRLVYDKLVENHAMQRPLSSVLRKKVEELEDGNSSRGDWKKTGVCAGNARLRDRDIYTKIPHDAGERRLLGQDVKDKGLGKGEACQKYYSTYVKDGLMGGVAGVW